jgi:hypothetical protein
MAVELPGPSSLVLGIASKFSTVAPDCNMVAHGSSDAAHLDCRRNSRSDFRSVSSGLVQAGVSRRQMANGVDSLMVSLKTHPSGPRIRAVQRSGRRDDLAWCHLRLPRAGETSDYLSGADAGCVIWGCSPARISQRKRRYIACSSLRSDTRFTTGADGRTPRSLCYSCRYRFLNLWHISLSCA